MRLFKTENKSFGLLHNNFCRLNEREKKEKRERRILKKQTSRKSAIMLRLLEVASGEGLLMTLIEAQLVQSDEDSRNTAEIQQKIEYDSFYL